MKKSLLFITLLCSFYSLSCFSVEIWMPPTSIEEFDLRHEKQYEDLKEWLKYDPREEEWQISVRNTFRKIAQGCKFPPMNLPELQGCFSDIRMAVDYNGRVISIFQTEDSPFAQCFTDNVKKTRFPAPLISPKYVNRSHSFSKFHCK